MILSCNTGEGHNTAANAIRERCEAEGHEAVVLDFLSLSGDRVSSFISNFYINMAKYIPYVFGFFYHFLLIISRFFHIGHSIVYLLNARIAPRLKEYLDQHQFDAIVATHLFPADAMTKIKQMGYRVPLFVMVATDYTCYPFLEEALCDYYILPHEAITPLYLERGIPGSRLCPWGIPVGMRFQCAPTREEARKALAIHPNARLHLVMGGSMGAGKMRAFTRRLSKRIGDGKIIVICGRNRKLMEAMQKRFGKVENVEIVGFTNAIPTYMKACDVLYTKPGGLTSTEAMVCGTPTVHTRPIPGCEGDNMRFFRERGLSWYAKTVNRQVYLGCRLAFDTMARERMLQCQARDRRPDAAAEILQLITCQTDKK